MRRIGFSLVAAAALLASAGAADAKDPPVKLTDVQLDQAIAGDSASVIGTDLSNFGRDAGHFISNTYNRLTNKL